MIDVALIAAVGQNGVIGETNSNLGLPWDLPDDRAYFKKMTTGKVIVEGRATYTATGRLLPNRTTIILSRDPSFAVAGAYVANSVDAALELGARISKKQNSNELMIVGGTQVFAQCLAHATRMYLTEVHATPRGDAHFPPYNHAEWREVQRTHHRQDARHQYAFDFVTYERA